MKIKGVRERKRGRSTEWIPGEYEGRSGRRNEKERK